MPGLGPEPLPPPERILLAGHLKGKRFLHPFIGGDVLDLCPPPVCLSLAFPVKPASWLDGDICIDTEGPLFLAVEDTEILEGCPELVQEFPGFLGRPDVWLGHDLDQGNPGPVIIDEGVLRPVGTALVHEPARIFLNMHPRDPDPFLTVITFDVKIALHGEGTVVLGDLESFVQVRVEVVLPCKLRLLNDGAVQRFCHPEGILDRLPVHPRERAREAETDRADVGVRAIIAVIGGAAAEELGQGVELAVDLEADDHLVIGEVHHPAFLSCSVCRSSHRDTPCSKA
ncbi:MAG: hypothetical protein BWY93_01451 [Euryarchaeota archaeon ADurb.BinA087]|nr:MAG: hypothetical protein BWY93_01451 [Euryarchaeota archaeon ADurb.BinA087]